MYKCSIFQLCHDIVLWKSHKISKIIQFNLVFSKPNNLLPYTAQSKYSQSYVKKSPLGQRASGLIRPVASCKRFNSYEILYDRTAK